MASLGVPTDPHSVHPKVTRLTSVQHGLITRDQLRQIPLTRSSIRHLVDSGRLIHLTRRVLMIPGVPHSELVDALCAALDTGGVLSHSSGLALWGVPGFDISPVHTTRLRGGRVRRNNISIIHEPRQLMCTHITLYRDVPVLRPARLLFDLASDQHPAKVERVLDWMWTHRLVTIPAMERTLEEIASNGRSGVTVMRSLISARRDMEPFGSNLESRFNRIAEQAGLPAFRRQVDLGSGTEWIGRVDFVSTTKLLVIEIDSEIHHSALSDQRRDAEQRTALESAGFMVRVLDESDLFHGGTRVLELLRSWYREAPSR